MWLSNRHCSLVWPNTQFLASTPLFQPTPNPVVPIALNDPNVHSVAQATDPGVTSIPLSQFPCLIHQWESPQWLPCFCSQSYSSKVTMPVAAPGPLHFHSGLSLKVISSERPFLATKVCFPIALISSLRDDLFTTMSPVPKAMFDMWQMLGTY